MSDFGSYITSDVGRSKVITVVLGLGACIMLSHAVTNSTYAMYSSNCKLGCPRMSTGCPPRPCLWLLYVGVLGACIGSTIVIIGLAVAFSKVMEHPKMKAADAVGHLIAGVLSLGMGAYGIYWAYEGKRLNPCDNQSSEECISDRIKKMQPTAMIFGVVLVILNGFKYIITGLMIKKAATAAAPASAAA